MRIEQDIKLDYKDVLFKPKRSTLESRREVRLERTFNFHNSGQQWVGVPIMASNMDGVGTFSMAKVLQEHKMLTVIRKHYSLEQWQKAKGVKMQYVSVCTGTAAIWNDDAVDYQTMRAVLAMYPDIPFITVDVANAYHENFGHFIARLRDEYPDKTIIAGNVITGEMTEELIIRGADIVKCGIGPGSVCTTRLMTGVGVPQLSGIIECADAANGIGGHIVADGGCVYPGDVAKAFGGGADFVMLGGMFAGHEEGGGKKIKKNGSQFIEFYGSSSDTALDKHYGGLSDYRSSEGKKVQLKYRGKIKDTVLNILGGVRSSCTYVGAPSLKQLSKCTTFIRVNQQFNDTFE